MGVGLIIWLLVPVPYGVFVWMAFLVSSLFVADYKSNSDDSPVPIQELEKQEVFEARKEDISAIVMGEGWPWHPYTMSITLRTGEKRAMRFSGFVASVNARKVIKAFYPDGVPGSESR
jgi:hypothetical protein